MYELLLFSYIDWCMNFCYYHIIIYLYDVKYNMCLNVIWTEFLMKFVHEYCHV
jgi:hypothetical protein